MDAVAKRIDAVGKQIEDLNAKVAVAAAEQKATLKSMSDELGKKKDAAAAELKTLREAAADKWESMCAKLDAAVTDLERATTDALK